MTTTAFPPGVRACLLSACALLLFACSSSSGPAADGGTPPAGDAGAAAADAGVESDAGVADAGGIPGGGILGKACEKDEDCAGGLCLASTHLCTVPCATKSDCPATPEWTCLFVGGSDQGSCNCQPAEGGEQCNGKDDDCNGLVDDGAEASCPSGYSCSLGRCHCPESQLCGDVCVDRKSDPEHCGECGHACGQAEACVDGVCGCAGMTCGGKCVDTRSERASCGNCNASCRAGEDCVDSACVAADREWARWVVRDTDSFASSGSDVLDQASLLVWQRTLSEQAYTREDAAAYCDALVSGDGHDDWRLPTRIELLSLVDFTQHAPAIDQVAFPDTPSSFFWSASTSAAEPEKGWAVNFNDGYAGVYPAAGEFRVRCVRQ